MSTYRFTVTGVNYETIMAAAHNEAACYWRDTPYTIVSVSASVQGRNSAGEVMLVEADITTAGALT